MKKQSAVFASLLVAGLIACGPSDGTINAKVKEKLAADDTIKAAPIDAVTQKRVVTLSGAVDAQAVKERAVTVARQVDGVSDVVDQITVRQWAPGPDTGHEMMNKEMKMGNKHGEEGNHH